MLHLPQNTMPVENERGNENEINNTGKNKTKNKHTKKKLHKTPQSLYWWNSPASPG